MLLINPYRFSAPRFISNDADVAAYVLTVEAADGQQLESGVISAYDSFITGCKSDGIWSAIKSSCILAGARTLDGAIVPLTGSAPTNFNFVTSDYNRVTGLKGNGTTKYLSSNRNNNADPQNSKHLACYVTQLTSSGGFYMGGAQSTNGHSFIYFFSNTRISNNANSAGSFGITHAAGLLGGSRSNASTFIGRANKTNFGDGSTSLSLISQTPGNVNLAIFARVQSTSASSFATGRVSYYSIGESIDLAKLDTRVSTLMTDLSAAIP